jgi:IS30 family transposase
VALIGARTSRGSKRDDCAGLKHGQLYSAGRDAAPRRASGSGALVEWSSRTADHDARQQRARPRTGKLAANITLRRLVQRKLNRCWSPDEICGWLRKTYPDDPSMRLCPETIYQELLLRDNTTLHKRYCLKLRTGRRIRKSRWLTRTGHGPTIANKTMIDQRSASAETKLEAGHWESQCCCQAA